MITKLYHSIAAGTITSLLLATLAVAPVAAQSSSTTAQGSGQAQSQAQPGQDPCTTLGQSLSAGVNR